MVVFCTWSRNSALLLVSFIRSISTSSACCGSSACSTRRSCQTILSSSGVISRSSLRVLDASTSTAGKIRLSASSRRSRSSMLPVPLNSSKITSSARDPVSIRAVARIVSEPPCSMLRAAPKNRFGGYSALDGQFGDSGVVLRGPVEGRVDDLALDRALHVGDFLRALVHQDDHEVALGVVLGDRVGDRMQ